MFRIKSKLTLFTVDSILDSTHVIHNEMMFASYLGRTTWCRCVQAIPCTQFDSLEPTSWIFTNVPLCIKFSRFLSVCAACHRNNRNSCFNWVLMLEKFYSYPNGKSHFHASIALSWRNNNIIVGRLHAILAMGTSGGEGKVDGKNANIHTYSSKTDVIHNFYAFE